MGEALVHHGANAEEADASLRIVAEGNGGVVEQVPDEEIFELVVIFFEIPCGLEMMIEEI